MKRTAMLLTALHLFAALPTHASAAADAFALDHRFAQGRDRTQKWRGRVRLTVYL